MRKAFARMVALLAIGGCAAAIYLVVHANLRHDHSPATTATTTTTTPSSKRKKSHHTLYTVKAGDTLSQIANKHHVSESQIKRLNPHLDQRGLQPGQRIHLR